MEDNFQKEMDEAIGEALPALPEAPLSINIGSYYKGFYVGWTKRSADDKVTDKVEGIKKFVDSLVIAGFMPSWNKQTSQEALKPEAEKFVESLGEPTPEKKVLCAVCHKNYHDPKWNKCYLCNKK